MLNKEIKQEIKAEYFKDKENGVVKEQKKALKKAYKEAEKPERKKAKKKYKYYKKFKNRWVRRGVGIGFGLLLIFLVIKIQPIVADISDLLAIDVNSDTDAARAALADGEIIAEQISDEGIILLKNQDHLLPLTDMKVNVFGYSAFSFKHGGAGSGGADQSRSISFFQGLTNAGIEYNKDLYQLYSSQNEDFTKKNENGLMEILLGRLGSDKTLEPEISYLTDEALEQAKTFSDTAVIVIANGSVEASDIDLSVLQLEKNQTDLIERVTEYFDQVIIIVNSGNPVELGFVDENDSIKSVLWVGTPGSKGTNSIGKVLAGEVNPSGRLTDTYVYDLTDHPTTVTYGQHAYENLEGMSYLTYNEGIYLGYRYFETYYLDDEAGYEKAVQYPFGYGLSYTEFQWQVDDYRFDEVSMEVDVTVTNTGDRAGKDVVQVYFTPPYYEGGIEKSAIELATYAKTKELSPGESQQLTLVFATNDMSSYDMNQHEAYVLEKGSYEIHISKNVHESVETLTYEVASDVIIDADPDTGTAYENQFDYANGDVTYLSRSDWSGTYPTVDALDGIIDDESLEMHLDRTVEPVNGTVVTDAENGLMLADLKDKSFDDPLWQDYIEQFSVEELIELFVNGGWRTVGVERLGLPSTILLDGPAGINFFFGNVTSASYPTEIVIASTWNDDLAYEMGVVIGAEAKALGVNGWYAPGMNLHRLPNGGRNFEYYSEDPLLSGRMAAGMVQGAQTNDIMVFIKHFVLNDVEINARKGMMVWANEQAIRELYLRPFELAVKDGEATGVMSSFIHIGPVWSGGNSDLLEDVLRDEWGFDGFVSSDAVQAGFMDVELSLYNGNDLMLNPLPTGHRKTVNQLYDENPNEVVSALQERIHHICYTILNYTDLLD